MVDCKLWEGPRNRGGYGLRWIKMDGNRRRMGVHRIACIEAHGPPPFPKADAMHSCDNRLCYEPSHLSWGSRLANMRDAASKGRVRRGAGHYRTLMHEDDVRFIRSMVEMGVSRLDLAKQYGIHRVQIGRIALRKQWKHL